MARSSRTCGRHANLHVDMHVSLLRIRWSERCTFSTDISVCSVSCAEHFRVIGNGRGPIDAQDFLRSTEVYTIASRGSTGAEWCSRLKLRDRPIGLAYLQAIQKQRRVYTLYIKHLYHQRHRICKQACRAKKLFSFSRFAFRRQMHQSTSLPQVPWYSV